MAAASSSSVTINADQMRTAVVADGTYNGYKYDILKMITAAHNDDNDYLKDWLTTEAKEAFSEMKRVVEST